MKRRIILLTNTFPFGGEEFLWAELQWAHTDHPVSVLPIHVSARKPAPVLPAGMEASADMARPAWTDMLAAAAHAFASLIGEREWRTATGGMAPVRNLAKAWKFSWVGESRARAIARHLKKRYPGEKFVFYSYWLYETAYAAMRLAQRFSGSRVVSRCHGFDLYEQRHPGGYLPFREALLCRLDAVCPISEDGADRLRHLTGRADCAEIIVHRLGSVDQGTGPVPRGQRCTLVSCSHLVKVKRVDRILTALCGATEEISWYHFGDGEQMEELSRMVKALPDCVDAHLMGAYPRERLMEFYRTHPLDVFLNVSDSEGVPVAMMEALSFGIPVIAPDVGGIREIVEHGRNGVLLRENFEGDDILRAIRFVLDDTRKEKMRRAAREIWEERYRADVLFPPFYRMLTGGRDEEKTGEN